MISAKLFLHNVSITGVLGNIVAVEICVWLQITIKANRSRSRGSRAPQYSPSPPFDPHSPASKDALKWFFLNDVPRFKNRVEGRKVGSRPQENFVPKSRSGVKTTCGAPFDSLRMCVPSPCQAVRLLTPTHDTTERRIPSAHEATSSSLSDIRLE